MVVALSAQHNVGYLLGVMVFLLVASVTVLSVTYMVCRHVWINVARKAWRKFRGTP
jgi:hypothetical protein